MTKESDHPLRVYLRKTGETQRAFCARAGLSEPFVSDVITGRRKPGVDALRKIKAATGGKVKADQLL